MKNIRLSLLITFVISVCCSAHAQFTATYSFTSAITDTPSVTNVTFGSLTATNVTLAYSSSNSNTTTSAWVLSGSSADTTEYLSFTLNANTGYQLDVTQLTFKESRSSTGPASMSIAVYTGGILQETSSTFTTTNAAGATTASMISHTFDFADLTSVAATSIIQFRIYGWGGTNAGGTLRLDDLSVSGTAAAVPEPSTYALLGGFAALCLVAYRRKTRLGR